VPAARLRPQRKNRRDLLRPARANGETRVRQAATIADGDTTYSAKRARSADLRPAGLPVQLQVGWL